MQIQHNVLRRITRVPWYTRNEQLWRDLEEHTIKREIIRRTKKAMARIENAGNKR